MFNIGKELGWNEKYRKNEEWQEKYLQDLSQNMDNDKGIFNFSEMLDNLVTFYVIKQQVRKEMQKQGIDV